MKVTIYIFFFPSVHFILSFFNIFLFPVLWCWGFFSQFLVLNFLKGQITFRIRRKQRAKLLLDISHWFSGYFSFPNISSLTFSFSYRICYYFFALLLTRISLFQLLASLFLLSLVLPNFLYLCLLSLVFCLFYPMSFTFKDHEWYYSEHDRKCSG